MPGQVPAYVALDYAALACLLVFVAAYTAACGWLVWRWLRAEHPASEAPVSRALQGLGAILPQPIAVAMLYGGVRVGEAGELWFLPTALGLVLGLGTCGALAARAWQVGAPRTTRLRAATAAALLLVGIAASMVWVQTHHTRLFEGGDGPAYDILGLNFMLGHGFTFGTSGTPLVNPGPYSPTMHREPLYPAYVALFYLLFGAGNWEAVALSQTLLMGGLALATYAAVRQVFGESAGVVAGMLTGASPDHGDLARQLMTEPLFVPFFVSAVAFAVLAQRTGRLRWYVAAGAGFALASLVRVFASVFFPVFGVIWLLMALRARDRQMARGVVACAGAFLLVLAPWVARNAVEFGVPFVAGRYGNQFLPRAAKAEASLEMNIKWAKAALYAATTPLSELIYPISRFQYGAAVWENQVWDFHVNDANAVLGRRIPCPPDLMGRVSSEACETRYGLQVALTHLPQYAFQTIFEFVKFNFYPFPSALAAYRNSLVWAALITGFTLLLRRRLQGTSLWLFVFLGTYVGIAVQVDAWERHAMPLLPLYYGFSAVGLIALIERAASLLAARRRPVAVAT